MLMGGMNLSADIEAKSIKNVLYVTQNAITTVDGKSTVRVKADNDGIMETEIEVGENNGSIVEIKSGIEEGDTLILQLSK